MNARPMLSRSGGIWTMNERYRYHDRARQSVCSSKWSGLGSI